MNINPRFSSPLQKHLHPALFFFFLLLLTLGNSGCRNHFNWLQYTASDGQIEAAFKNYPEQPRIHYYQSNGRTLRYWEIGNDTLPVALLVHGAPSSMLKFRHWFRDTTLVRKMKLVAIDRPGYGRSGLGQAELSIVKQAEMLSPLVKELGKNRKIVLLGSSYGGAVAAKLAMDHPAEVGALMLLSASVEPEAENTPGLAYSIHNQYPFRWMAPRVARVATQEKFGHQAALAEIQDGWERIHCPVWIIHGKADQLIFYSNAEYAKAQLKNASQLTFLPFDKAGHFLFRMNRDSVTRYLLDAGRCVGECAAPEGVVTKQDGELPGRG